MARSSTQASSETNVTATGDVDDTLDFDNDTLRGEDDY